MRGKDSKLGFSEEDRKRIWKNFIKIMNKEIDWNHMTEARVMEGPLGKVTREEMVIAIKQ